MSDNLIFDVDGLSDPVEQRRPSWAAFSAWADAFIGSKAGDAEHNLCIACAVKPGPGELAALIDDEYGFLPSDLSDSLLEAAGLPGGAAGFGHLYAVVPLSGAKEAGVPEEVVKAATALREDGSRVAKRPMFALTPAGWWAFKGPSGNVASAYQDGAVSAAKGTGSYAENMRILTLACVISPDPAVARAKIEEYPAIPILLSRSIRAAGGEGKAKPRVRG